MIELSHHDFTPVERTEWEERGYLRLGKLLPPDDLAALQQRIDDIMLGRIRYDGMYFQPDPRSHDYGSVGGDGRWAGPTLDYRKIQDLERDPLFLGYIQHPKLRAITRTLIGEDVSIYRAMFMNKPARLGTYLPYHQDAGDQWGLTENPFMTVWTALDDATIENGCMQVIPGSHKLGLFSEHGHTITPEQEAEHAPDEKSVYLDAEAGEAILLHNLMLHRSGINRTDRPRRAFSVVYMDARIRSVRTGRPHPKVFGEGALSPEAAPEPVAA
jgi:phytanoyl-CoA hydroxylase